MSGDPWPPGHHYSVPQFYHPWPPQPDITVRDWFAAQALGEMGQWTPRFEADPMIEYGGETWWSFAHAARARFAYAAADAMLAERERKP